MIKKVLAIVGLVVVVSAMCFGIWKCNWHNGVGNIHPDCQEWFTDTGIDVKNFQNRLYHIVKDGNDWLYYCSDLDGQLTPVVSELGLPTKDIKIFE